MKIKLRNADFCDGCEHLVNLNTLGQHHRCKVYKRNMLAMDDIFFGSKGIGSFKRPEICKKENEVEIKR